MPAAAQYDLEQHIGSNKTIGKTVSYTFKNGYDKYKHTCDIQRNIKVYEHHAEGLSQGVASYDVARGLTATKKRNPGYSSSRAKQFTLWEQGKSFLDLLIVLTFRIKARNGNACPVLLQAGRPGYQASTLQKHPLGHRRQVHGQSDRADSWAWPLCKVRWNYGKDLQPPGQKLAPLKRPRIC